jgi:hypothetical protein
MGFVDKLQNHMSLNVIDFSRCELNEDMVSAVLQRVYMNPPI